MGKIILAAVLGIIVGVVGSWSMARYQWRQYQKAYPPVLQKQKAEVYPQPRQNLSTAPEAIKITFPQPVDSFEIEVRRDFEVVLEPDSQLPQISADRLTVTQPFPASAGSGTFTITYKGCPKGVAPTACFSDQFDFTIEPAR